MRWQWSLREFFLAVAAVGGGLTVTKLHVARTSSIGTAETIAYAVWATLSFLIAGRLLRGAIAQWRRYRALRGGQSDEAFAPLFQTLYQLACAALVPLGFAVWFLPLPGKEERLGLWHLEPALLYAGVVFGGLATAPVRQPRKRGWRIVDGLAIAAALVAMLYYLADDLLLHFLVFLAIHGVEVSRSAWHLEAMPARFPGDEAALAQYEELALVAVACWLTTLLSGYWGAKGSTAKRRGIAWAVAAVAGIGTVGLVGWHVRFGLASLSPDFASTARYDAPLSLLGLLLILLAASYLAFRSSLSGKRLTPAADEWANRQSGAACYEGAGSSWLMAGYLASWTALFALALRRQYGEFAALIRLPSYWGSDVAHNPIVWLMLALALVLAERLWNLVRGIRPISAAALPLPRRPFLLLWGLFAFCLLTAAPIAGWVGLAINLAMRRGWF